jgi:hypothetical protein
MISTIARNWSGNGLHVYTVHEEPNPPADRLDRAENLRFVRDGFSWGALLFGPLWLIAKARWLELVGYIVVTIAILGLIKAFGGGEHAPALALMALNAILAFEASTLERLSLERAGWQEIGTVTGRDLFECERRFFESWLAGQPIITPSAHITPIGTLTASSADGPPRSAAKRLRDLFFRAART